jgi:hypothetical protein
MNCRQGVVPGHRAAGLTLKQRYNTEKPNKTENRGNKSTGLKTRHYILAA